MFYTLVCLQRGDNLFPKDADGKWQFADTDYVDTWKVICY